MGLSDDLVTSMKTFVFAILLFGILYTVAWVAAFGRNISAEIIMPHYTYNI
jgi:hypothetical protein